MRLTIEPTESFFMTGEVMVRAWRGTDDAGRKVIALVAGVSVEAGGPAVELVPIPPPSDEDARRWATTILHGDDGGG